MTRDDLRKMFGASPENELRVDEDPSEGASRAATKAEERSDAELVEDASAIVELIQKARSAPVVRRGESPIIYKRSTLMPWRELSYVDQRQQKEILFRHRQRNSAEPATEASTPSLHSGH